MAVVSRREVRVVEYRAISEKIAFDGTGYSCRICGKAGYASVNAVKGHLSRCPARQIGTLQLAAASPASWQLAGSLATTENSASPAGPASQLAAPSPNARARESQLSWGLAQEVQELRAEVGTLKNEYSHVMQERALGMKVGSVGSDWFQRYKPFVIAAAVVLALVLVSNQSRSCPSVAGSGGKALTVRGFMEKGLNKIGDKALSKTADFILK